MKKIFIDKIDNLIVWRLDRLGRNMQDLIKVVNDLNERVISFYSTMVKKNLTGQLVGLKQSYIVLNPQVAPFYPFGFLSEGSVGIILRKILIIWIRETTF